MKYDRLTVRNGDKVYIVNGDLERENCPKKSAMFCSKARTCISVQNRQCYLLKMIDRLAELEDKIEQGTLIELPCKVGDWLYVIYDNKIIPRIAFAFEISGVSRYIKTTMGDIFVDSCIGKTLFFTREEAEKRLKELQNG